jgi:DUF2975 family protein
MEPSMSLAATPSSTRLLRLSRAMVWLASIGIVLVIVLTILALVLSDWTRNLLLARLGQSGSSLALTLDARLIAGAIVAVPVGVMVFGLWHVRAMFREFAAGHVFTEAAARHLQMFGAAMLAQAPLGPLTSIALSVGLTLANPPGQRMLAVSVSINDYFALIVGGVLFAAASVMREAARLADENASFV